MGDFGQAELSVRYMLLILMTASGGLKAEMKVKSFFKDQCTGLHFYLGATSVPLDTK